MVIKQEIKDFKKKYRKIVSKPKLCISFVFGLGCFGLQLFLLIADPLMMFIREYTKVTNGSFVHQMVMKEVEGVHISAYIFNITNPEEFMSGEHQKLKVKEVGPFTYKELRRNVDIDINTETQRMTYTPTFKLEYMPEKSIESAEDINVTVPNIPMLGLATLAGQFSYWAGLGFNVLSNQVNSKPIITVPADSYMWGYREPLISLAHKIIPGAVHFDKMGILDRMNDKKNINRVELSIAEEDKYMVKKLNGLEKLKMGDRDVNNCELCNTLENTFEGVGYPYGLTPERPVRIFRNGLCKILDLDYQNTVTTKYGSDALVYKISDNFFKRKPNEDGNGILELPECFFGVPLAFSKPHFIDSDPSVYEHIEGINPDAEKHKGWVTVDPKLGLTLDTTFSLQLNLIVGDVSANSKASRFSNMVLPICYIKITQPPLPAESMMFLDAVYIIGPNVLLVFQLVIVALGLLSWGYFFRAIYLAFLLNKDMTFPKATTLKDINANIEKELMIKIDNVVDIGKKKPQLVRRISQIKREMIM